MAQKFNRLVLFDIDGTVLNGGRLWRECIEASFYACCPGERLPHVSFSGKTDRQICREMLPTTLAPLLADQRIDDIIGGYLRRIESALSAGRASEVELLPGVRELLEELTEHRTVRLGLLTGNVRAGARIKLGSVALEKFFDPCFGAFGDDHWDRYQLPPIAVSRALEEFGEVYLGKQVVIVGDTVHDVNCGKAIGVRSIAVGTGRADHRPAILEAKPDYFFDTLREKSEVLEAILSEI